MQTLFHPVVLPLDEIFNRKGVVAVRPRSLKRISGGKEKNVFLNMDEARLLLYFLLEVFKRRL